MPLDSGTTSPKSPGSIPAWHQYLQDGFAYCENISITIIMPNISAIAAALETLGQPKYNELEEILSTPLLTRDALFHFIATLPRARDLLTSIKSAFYDELPSYVPPLFRLLRDHHFYALYELITLYHCIKSLSERKREAVARLDVFSHHSVLMCVIRLDERKYLITGPVVCNADRPNDGLFLRDIGSSLTRLNSDISSLSRYSAVSRIGWKTFGPRGPLYNVDTLVRSAFARQKTGLSELLLASRKIAHLYHAITVSDDLQNVSESIPVHMFTRIAATASALYDYSKTRRTTETAHCEVKSILDNGRSKPIHLLISCTGSVKIETTPKQNSSPITTYYIDRATDRGFTNWHAYLLESFDLIRSWLSNKFGYTTLHRTQNQRSNRSLLLDEKSAFRLTRFLSRLFRTEECTIYKLDYESESRCLVRVSAYLCRENEERRLDLMQDHMLAISNDTAKRKMSISYRAVDEIKTQYCRRAQLQRVDNLDCTITFPEHSGIDNWGVSAVACPILVQGAPWGVIELISDQPHHFAGPTRSKVEVVGGMLSSFFYFQSVFLALDNATNIANANNSMSDTQIPTSERKRLFLKALFDIFLCDSIAVVVREAGDDDASAADDDGHIVATLFGAEGDWWFSTAQQARPIKELLPIANLVFDDANFKSCSISKENDAFSTLASRGTRDAVEKFVSRNETGSLVFLQLHGRQNAIIDGKLEDFLLMLIFRKEIEINRSLLNEFLFFGSFLVPILETFYTTDNWERVLRNRLGHEMNKIWMNVNATQAKLEADFNKTSETRFSNNLDRSKYYHLVTDLKRHASGIKMYAEILSKKRENLYFQYHPQVFIARHKMASEERNKVSMRKIYASAFMNRSAEFTEKAISVDVFKEEDVVIFSYEWLLLDVLQTLADNVLKYAVPGHPVSVKVLRGGIFGNIRLQISNLAPALTEDDSARLFTEGARGAYALGKPGQGIGLFLAKTMMMEAGYDLSHGQRSPERPMSYEGYHVVWHDFTLAFPKGVLSAG